MLIRLMATLCAVSVMALNLAEISASENTAVLHIEKVFNEAKIVDASYDDFKVKAETVRDQIQAYTDQIETLKQVISTYHPSDPKFLKNNKSSKLLGYIVKCILSIIKNN